MKLENNSKLAIKIIWMVTIISLGANFFVVVSLVLFYLPILDDSYIKTIHQVRLSSELHRFIYILNMFLSFLVPSIFIIVYIFPLIKGILETNREKYIEIGKRRTVNLPIMIGLFTMIGWSIGFMQNMIDFSTIGISITLWVILRAIVLIITPAIFCFTIVYYSLDFVTRKYLFPFFFPDNRISDQKGIIHLSIYGKFFILVSSITLLPCLLFFNIIINRIKPDELSEIFLQIIVLVFFIILSSYFIGFLMTESFRKPLTDIKRATLLVKKGEYDIEIRVRSVDETGVLSETINEMAKSLKEKEFIKETFGKAVDYRVRDYFLQGNIKLGGQIQDAAILFSDIRGFTTYAEKRNPEEVVNLLNRFFEKMNECITKNGGMINKYIGDAILAVFNIPIQIEDYTDSAFLAAKDMLIELEKLNQELKKENKETIQIGIGLHSGKVLAGNIGSSDRIEYTVIGDTVNISSRLEGMSKEFSSPIIISETCFNSMKDNTGIYRLGKIKVKGRKESLLVYGYK